MEPTLHVGERIVVSKGRPTIGAIVVYYPPEGFATEECGPTPHVVKAGAAACAVSLPRRASITLVKRIVAGPGDEIYIREGHVYRKAPGSGSFAREHDTYIRACGDSPECDFPKPIKIPAGNWFLMGDNRQESDDSRFWGPVPTAWILGVVSASGDTSPQRTARQLERQSKAPLVRATARTPSAATVKVLLGEKCRKGCPRLIAKYGTCLLRNGVEVPHARASLLYDTKGIKTGGPHVREMVAECRRKSLNASLG